ncbi:MAG TPA: hypothetical protein VH575_09665 [Gemmataceae bacterium]|jgi:hypothetical protein
MYRFSVAFLIYLGAAVPLRAAEVFDYYVNPVLARAVEAKETKEVKKLTRAMILDNDRVLPRTTAALLVVQTNSGRYAKLLVQVARQKIDAEHAVPILLVEHYVTYKEGEERAVQAEGKNLSLFPGFRLSLDLGQVVPEELGGDLRFVVKDGENYTEPVGKARLYLVTKALADAAPKKAAKFVMGETFEPRYFNGTFRLNSDGRRSGKLTLKVDEDGSVNGSYYSDKDGAKYLVSGKIGTPKYSIRFTIKFPRSEEHFQGWLFTGDGQFLTGTSRLQEREAGFYAKRIEE